MEKLEPQDLYVGLKIELRTYDTANLETYEILEISGDMLKVRGGFIDYLYVQELSKELYCQVYNNYKGRIVSNKLYKIWN